MVSSNKERNPVFPGDWWYNYMKNEIELKPSYWASVSGGKDSLLMLKIILENPDKYPLDGVVHSELEIDFPFIKNVVDFMEKECKKRGIPFLRIKPRVTWKELYDLYGFPCRVNRWCNSKYKMDAFKQLDEFMKTKGYKVITYIGYCVDEVTRYDKRKNPNEIYPLVLENIIESDVLEWAQGVPLFNNYYITQKRCGCMYCPLSKYICLAYIFKYYSSEYENIMKMARETEKMVYIKNGKPFSVWQGNPKYNTDYVDNIVRTKWLKKLEEKEHEYYDNCRNT